MYRGLRYTFQLFIVTGALLVAMVVLAGRAHAADAPPDAAPSQQSSPPPAAAWPAPAPPAAPETNAVVGTDAADPTPADSPPAAAPPPSGTVEDVAWPTQTTNQQAQVTTSGAAVSTTGSNVAIGNGTGNPGGTGTEGASWNAISGVGSGPAVAAGDQSTSSIDQQVQVTASSGGQIEVLQVGLVINIGLAGANSGINAASAWPGVAGTGGSAAIGSGNANVTGNQAVTEVIQAAQITGGASTGQVVTVLNIGIGFGDTGTNLAVGTLYTEGSPDAQATAVVGSTSGSAQADIGTGAAGAIGNRADSGIVQITMAVASNGGVLSVAQRAVIVNVGIALANSGLNAAWASGISPEQAQLIQWVIESLLDEFGISPSAAGEGAFSGGSAGTAAIQAGTALAVGNDSTTGILQQVQGAVSGGVASADQQAMVGNFGLGVANTGLNAAGSSLTLANIDPGVRAQVEAAESALQRLVALFTDPSFTGTDLAAVQEAIDLGGALLSVNGDISAAETLAGVDEGMPGNASVSVRQVSAVLNIGISFANTGDNISVSVVTADPDAVAVADATGESVDVSHIAGNAVIRTGDAFVVGNHSFVRVCQADHDDACDPPPVTPPVDPPVNPPVTPPGGNPIEVLPGVVGGPGASAPAGGASEQAGVLAFTGSALLDQASAGLGLAAAGASLMGLRRRRRRKDDDRTDDRTDDRLG